MNPIRSSEITPEAEYFARANTRATGRRRFLKFGAMAAASLAVGACSTSAASQPAGNVPTGLPATPVTVPGAGATTDELGDALTPYDTITSYNNYYEFSTDKETVAPLAKNFVTSPWEVKIGGLVNQPQTLGLEDILKRFPQEERVYRLRCVEGWSMVIPWQGFPLASLLKLVEPTSDAKYVRFETVYAPDKLPGQNEGWFNWPYVEGLRLDEAMNDLALLATGVYGKPLPPQNGAPIRLAVPWKYGFKSIKAIVKIDLVAEQPSSLWMDAAGDEYGFYANVNPDVPHPRWSQSTERRLGEVSRRRTLKFNGYAGNVEALYTGMDLKANY